MFSVLAMSCSFFSSLQSRFWWMSCCRLDVELQRVRFVTGVNDLSGRFSASGDFCVARCPLSPSQFVFAPSMAISQEDRMGVFVLNRLSHVSHLSDVGLTDFAIPFLGLR